MRLLQRVGILTFLLVIIFQFDTYAKELDTSWSNKCTSEFGAIPTGKNPSLQHVNCLLTNAAINSNIPPEVVKAVAEKENGGWKHFSSDNTPIVTTDGGIGLMQITNKPKYDQEKLKMDVAYNIQAGVEILKEMYTRTDLPKIKGAGEHDIENWYFAVMAYNGKVQQNSPLIRSSKLKNKDAYQEVVFSNLYKNSFLLGEERYINSIPFDIEDLIYEETGALSFKKTEYELTDRLNGSNYFFENGDSVLVATDVNFRSGPSTNSSVIQKLPRYTTLTITGKFKYQIDSNFNQFVWYPAKTTDGKIGFISSAYITNAKQIRDIKFTSSTTNSLTLTWTKQTGVSGYEIYNVNTGKAIKVTGADTNSYTINNLSSETAYQFKIRSYETYGSNHYYNGYSETLTAVTLPTKVMNLKVASSTANSVKLTWAKQSGVSGYEIYNTKTGKLIAKINSNTNSYTINKLSAGTSYQFKVRSYNTAGTGAFSTTLTTVTPTAQVTNLKVSSRTTNSLKLTWTKQSGVTGYQIYQYDSKSKTYKLYKTITSNTNSYTISKLGAGTTYSYKVRSYKTISKVNYYGAFSSQLTTITNPATVTLSSVKKASSTSMKVNWKKITASTGYQIQYSTSNKFTSNTTKTVTIKNKNTVTNTIKSLKKGKKYYVRVRSYVTLSKNNYYGSWSTVKNITLK